MYFYSFWLLRRFTILPLPERGEYDTNLYKAKNWLNYLLEDLQNVVSDVKNENIIFRGADEGNANKGAKKKRGEYSEHNNRPGSSQNKNHDCDERHSQR